MWTAFERSVSKSNSEVWTFDMWTARFLTFRDNSSRVWTKEDHMTFEHNKNKIVYTHKNHVPTRVKPHNQPAQVYLCWWNEIICPTTRVCIYLWVLHLLTDPNMKCCTARFQENISWLIRSLSQCSITYHDFVYSLDDGDDSLTFD